MTTTYLPASLSVTQLHCLCADVKQRLGALYGDRLNKIILYGSYARGDFHEESDIDFLIVLHDQVIKFGQEIWFMGDCLGELSYQYGVFISAKPASVTQFVSSSSVFYEAVRSQGKVL